MARNFAFNAAARSKLQKAMLHKMAVNAKKAKDDLDHSMRFVQAKFASAAKLQNTRNTANIARSKAIREVISKNKAEARKHLESSVATQQRAMAALASATNARISKTNKHVAVNAAQIKENAKKAPRTSTRPLPFSTRRLPMLALRPLLAVASSLPSWLTRTRAFASGPPTR